VTDTRLRNAATTSAVSMAHYERDCPQLSWRVNQGGQSPDPIREDRIVARAPSLRFGRSPISGIRFGSAP
jgi:hypothetical protein